MRERGDAQPKHDLETYRSFARQGRCSKARQLYREVRSECHPKFPDGLSKKLVYGCLMCPRAKMWRGAGARGKVGFTRLRWHVRRTCRRKGASRLDWLMENFGVSARYTSFALLFERFKSSRWMLLSTWTHARYFYATSTQSTLGNLKLTGTAKCFELGKLLIKKNCNFFFLVYSAFI